MIKTIDELRAIEQPPGYECINLGTEVPPTPQLEAINNVFEDSAAGGTAPGDSALEIPPAEGRDGICRWNFEAALPELYRGGAQPTFSPIRPRPLNQSGH